MQHITENLAELKSFYQNQTEDIHAATEALKAQYEATLAEYQSRLKAVEQRIQYVEILSSDFPSTEENTTATNGKSHRTEGTTGKYVQQSLDMSNFTSNGYELVGEEHSVLTDEEQAKLEYRRAFSTPYQDEPDNSDAVVEEDIQLEPESEADTEIEPVINFKHPLLLRDSYRRIYLVLQKHKGKVLHINYILTNLKPHLKSGSEMENQARKRLQGELVYGAKRGLWLKVPDEEACYSIES